MPKLHSFFGSAAGPNSPLCIVLKELGETMKLSRRHFLHAASGAAALQFAPRAARAQVYPSRPIRLIVTFGAGTAPDIVARLIGQWLSERVGQQFVIENRPGFGGNIATEYVVRAAPDGYTLLMPVSSNAINATLYPNLNFNFIRDIAPVAGIATTPFVGAVPTSFPAKTVPDLLPMQRPIPARSTWARLATAVRTTSSVKCSRSWPGSIWFTSHIAPVLTPISVRTGAVRVYVQWRECLP